MRKFGNVYLISSIAIIGSCLLGIAGKGYLCYFNQGPIECAGPYAGTQGGILASMSGGSFLASFFSGYLSDPFGRKKAIRIGSLFWIVGCAIVSASQNIPMLILGRIINGLSVGICSAQVPVYISEIAPPTKRGRLVGTQQWAITWGILIMFYISYGCSGIDGTAAFRIPWALQMIPAIVLLICIGFVPESPRWLASQDRWEECEQVLILTHGHGSPFSPWVARELQEIREWLESECMNKTISYAQFFTPRYLNRTQIGLATQIWSQLTGINVIMYYITYVFRMANVNGDSLLVSSSIAYVVNMLMTIPALIWIDRVGRRPALLGGSILMAAWLFAISATLAVHGRDPGPNGVDGIREASILVTGGAAKAVIACSILFVASFSPTWGPVSWIYPPELYPTHLRAKAVALTTSANWLFNFALALFVPVAFVHIKWKTYIIFATFCVVMTIHVFFFFPETAGKPLEEVNEMFEDPRGIKYLGTPAWKTGSYYNEAQRFEEGQDLSKQFEDTSERRNYSDPWKT